MQQRIHMQDQVSNRIKMLMGQQHQKIKQATDDIATFIFVVLVLSLRVVW